VHAHAACGAIHPTERDSPNSFVESPGRRSKRGRRIVYQKEICIKKAQLYQQLDFDTDIMRFAHRRSDLRRTAGLRRRDRRLRCALSTAPIQLTRTRETAVPITVFIRYQLDPSKRDAFEEHACRWQEQRRLRADLVREPSGLRGLPGTPRLHSEIKRAFSPHSRACAHNMASGSVWAGKSPCVARVLMPGIKRLATPI
jgi:hypothetical protein